MAGVSVGSNPGQCMAGYLDTMVNKALCLTDESKRGRNSRLSGTEIFRLLLTALSCRALSPVVVTWVVAQCLVHLDKVGTL